jgi:hypothetical protein
MKIYSPYLAPRRLPTGLAQRQIVDRWTLQARISAFRAPFHTRLRIRAATLLAGIFTEYEPDIEAEIGVENLHTRLPSPGLCFAERVYRCPVRSMETGIYPVRSLA